MQILDQHLFRDAGYWFLDAGQKHRCFDTLSSNKHLETSISRVQAQFSSKTNIRGKPQNLILDLYRTPIRRCWRKN